MIAKISPGRGSSPVGLAMYLFGPGKQNEHRDMRVIAAADALGVPDGHRLNAKKNRDEVVALGQRLDYGHKMFGTEVPGGHVWHMSLSLPAGEHLTDEQWAQVAREAMDVLGFSGADGKAPCRWIAVAHGVSAKENEHIHLAVPLIRGDGTRASYWNDRRTMSKFAADIEKRFGLFVVEGRAGAGKPSLSRAELERAASTSTDPERTRLGRMVRAHAQASAGEAEFARRLRGDEQLLARPRFAGGGRNEVVGYSVALAPEGEAKPLWFGGGRLGPDLSLPKLRARWAEATEQWRVEAVAAWSTSTKAGRESRSLHPEAWPAATAEVERTIARLGELGPDAAGEWAGAAWEMAGVFATLSTRLEPDGGPLGEMADALAAASWRRYRQAPARRSPAVSGLRGVAMVCRQAALSLVDDVFALIRALLRMVEAIGRARILTERANAAERMLAAVTQTRTLLPPETIVDEGASPRAARAAAARSTSPGARTGRGRGAEPPPFRLPPPGRPGPDRGLGR